MELDFSDDSSTTPSKRHKRHKHKKHKRKKMQEDSDGSLDLSIDDDVIVKIKSPVAFSEKSKMHPSKSPEKILASPSASSTKPNANVKKKKGRGRDSGTSSEEERWLDAIESGKLEDVDDELKKIKPKDPKLMTARQRAMYERGNDKESSPGGEALLALPSGYKEKVMTAEAIQKAALKSQKRKQLADEKREKDKKRTMERLLKKQESKATKAAKVRSVKRSIPIITYKINAEQMTLSYPDNVPYPLKAKGPPKIPRPVKCSVVGCNNLKKYSCSKTNVPLCSLECYNINKLIRA